MRCILFFYAIVVINAMEPFNIFDTWTDMFRPLPRNPKEGFLPDYTPHDQEEFDFIIIGAGSAGCVLANRLTEVKQWKVLLLEAGGNENFFSDIPIFAAFLSLTPMNWGYTSEPQEKACKDLRGKVCFLPRGKVLGGSSVLNFLIYQRGHQEDYNDWSRMGNAGWSYSEVLPYFKMSENIRIPELMNSSYHGRGGYLDIDYAPYRSPLESVFRRAGEELGYEWRDPNGENVIGFSKPQATMRKGRRCSTSKAFLEPVRFRPNLKVSKYSTATKLLIDRKTKTTYGVEFIKRNIRYQVRARREVILAAGTIGSAQLLMVSGIGPRRHLQETGIEPLIDLPVGYNLQDHITFSGNAFIVNDSRLCVNDLTAASPFSAAAYLAGTGPLTLPGGAAGMAFTRTRFSEDHAESRPDIEIVMGAGSLAGDMLGVLRGLLGVTDEWFWKTYGTLPAQARQRSFAMNPVLIRPRSVGRLTLRSARVADPPRIHPNYFHHPDDLNALREGVRFVENIIKTKAFQRYGTRLHDTPFPGCEHLIFDSDDYWACAIMQTSITLDHQDFKLAEYRCHETCIIAFCSEEAKKMINAHKIFYGDGTFHSCPSPFQQMYTIHGDVGSTTECLNIVPLIYVFMTDSTTQSYVTAFNIIKRHLPGLEHAKWPQAVTRRELCPRGCVYAARPGCVWPTRRSYRAYPPHTRTPPSS